MLRLAWTLTPPSAFPPPRPRPAPELSVTVDSILPCLSQLTISPHDAQLLNLLPLCILRIKAKGPELPASLLGKILDCEWPKGVLVRLIPMAMDRGFQEVDRETIRSFLGKVFRGLPNVDVSDWPSEVYQLLVRPLIRPEEFNNPLGLIT